MADSPHFVQISPKVHLGGVRADLDQVPSKKHLAPLDLGALLVKELFDRRFNCSVVGHEGSCGDVLFEKLLIDDVDDGGYQCFDVLVSTCKCLNVIW